MATCGRARLAGADRGRSGEISRPANAGVVHPAAIAAATMVAATSAGARRVMRGMELPHAVPRRPLLAGHLENPLTLPFRPSLPRRLRETAATLMSPSRVRELPPQAKLPRGYAHDPPRRRPPSGLAH